MSPVCSKFLSVTPGYVFIVQKYLARCRCIHTAQYIQYSGFTGSARTDYDCKLAFFYREIDILQCFDINLTHMINLFYVLKFYETQSCYLLGAQRQGWFCAS